MAHALTAVRLGLVLPVAWSFAHPPLLPARVLFALVCLAIATDYADGKVARLTATASPRGQLFDHTTDFVFVTAGLVGAAIAGHVTAILPPLIVVAFGQYVLDSYFLYRQKELRMSAIGRWNGVLYFVPLVLISASGLSMPGGLAAALLLAARAAGYALSVSTVVSVIDRAVAPLRHGR